MDALGVAIQGSPFKGTTMSRRLSTIADRTDLTKVNDLEHASPEAGKLPSRLKAFSVEIQAVAAVTLLLREVGEKLELLVVKRVENPKDPWSGQMALPGGRHETKDRNMRETAIRETLEETGIDLTSDAYFLGVLEVVRSAVRPDMTVLPFVALLERDPEIRLSSRELERYVWVTPKQLIENKGTTRFSFGTFPAFIVGSNVIWGLTYMILTRFLELLQ
jgi:8-oxo-dGTP pyrophosphatase MutT (NUDIX family)